MLYATHCDGLVLGMGRSPARAERDAKLHGAEDESLLTTCRITLEAYVHVLAGGDCRRLKWVCDDGDSALDYFSLDGEALQETGD